MSYKVLARKWRPQHFNDMLGQEPVLRALVNALDTDRLHHAYLFTGMRGVGKTSIARIFAKCLNCETKGVSSDPCGTCSACQDIDAGRFFDLIEVDAASRTKVEGTRELLENVPYAPASGRFKVYLIDEVHMFSTHSFNALLKTLEEPPEHVKFLLATTDPQKVPATVLSRCLQFNLKRISPGMLTDYLSKLLTEEGIEHELPALDLIARASEGSVRDSLSLVEQATAGGEGAIRAVEVESMLGRASVERLLSLIETLAAGDMPGLFAQVEELAQYAPEFSELLGELLSLLHRIALLRTVPDSVPNTLPGYERLAALANSLHPDEVQLFYQIGLHARRDMPFAPDTREAFDMALLRMHTFKPQQDMSGIAPPVAPLTPQSPLAGGGAPQPQLTGQRGSAAQITATKGVGSTSAGAAPSPPVSSPSALSSPDTAAQGLPVRGSVSAGGSMRAAALAAARGEPLPDDVAQQVAALSGLPTSADALKASATPASAKPAPSTPASAKPESAKPAPSTPASAKPESAKPAPSTPASAKPESAKPAPSTPASAKPESAKPEGSEAQTDQPEQAALADQSPQVNAASALDKLAVTSADWPVLVTELDIAGMPLQLASHCACTTIQGASVALQLEESSEHLHKAQFIERLQNALNSWFESEVKLSIDVVTHAIETPAKLTEKRVAENLAAAHDSIKLDPIVLQLIDKVDGAVDEASIRPIDR